MADEKDHITYDDAVETAVGILLPSLEGRMFLHLLFHQMCRITETPAALGESLQFELGRHSVGTGLFEVLLKNQEEYACAILKLSNQIPQGEDK